MNTATAESIEDSTKPKPKEKLLSSSIRAKLKLYSKLPDRKRFDNTLMLAIVHIANKKLFKHQIHDIEQGIDYIADIYYGILPELMYSLHYTNERREEFNQCLSDELGITIEVEDTWPGSVYFVDKDTDNVLIDVHYNGEEDIPDIAYDEIEDIMDDEYYCKDYGILEVEDDIEDTEDSLAE